MHDRVVTPSISSRRRPAILAVSVLLSACASPADPGASPGSGGTAPDSQAVGGSDSGNPSTGGAAGSGGATAAGGALGTGGDPAPVGPASGGQTSGGGQASGGQASGGGTSSGGGSGVGSCPSELVGWASVSGDQVSTTTGGGAATPVAPTTLAELEDYASDDQPRVIHIEGTWELSGRLSVASNKTLVGIGPAAELHGGVRIRGHEDDFVQNVIIQNLSINGATTDVDGDAMQIYFAHHVWIDHCEIWDGVDANLDVVHGSNWITLSWTKFRYTSAAPDPDHKFSTLIGHSDSNADEDDGRLKVTLHHNWWAEGVTERMPRVRFGEVHSFNNYFASAGNNYCIRGGRNAHILSEGSFFDSVNSPHEFNSIEDEATAHITARENGYQGTPTDDGLTGGGTSFEDPPYAYALNAASDVPSLVQACAGPR